MFPPDATEQQPAADPPPAKRHKAQAQSASSRYVKWSDHALGEAPAPVDELQLYLTEPTGPVEIHQVLDWWNDRVSKTKIGIIQYRNRFCELFRRET